MLSVVIPALDASAQIERTLQALAVGGGAVLDAVGFAAAASCLAHSVVGDFNYASRAEVEALMGGSTSGRVVR